MPYIIPERGFNPLKGFHRAVEGTQLPTKSQYRLTKLRHRGIRIRHRLPGWRGKSAAGAYTGFMWGLYRAHIGVDIEFCYGVNIGFINICMYIYIYVGFL